MHFKKLIYSLLLIVLFYGCKKINCSIVCYVTQEGEDIMRAKPETREQIELMLSDIDTQWQELETTTKAKGEKLFDANRSILYQQSCDDVDGWVTALESQIITSEDFGKDLTTVNLQVQKQNVSVFFWRDLAKPFFVTSVSQISFIFLSYIVPSMWWMLLLKSALSLCGDCRIWLSSAVENDISWKLCSLAVCLTVCQKTPVIYLSVHI